MTAYLFCGPGHAAPFTCEESMEEEQIRQTTIIVALAAGMVLFFLYYWDPIGRVVRKYEPDPEKGFKIIFLVGLALWVIVGALMSIGIMFRLLGVL